MKLKLNDSLRKKMDLKEHFTNLILDNIELQSFSSH